MTVETSTRKVTLSGGQSSLAFSFRTLVSHPEYIYVAVVNLTTGTQTILTYNVNYTVSVNSDGVGGTVTVSPSYSTAYNYVVYRQTGILQDSAYSDFNQFPASTLEDNLDQLTMIAQEEAEDTARTPVVSIAFTGTSITLPTPLDAYSLVWSGASGVLINSNITGPSGSTGAAGSNGQGVPTGGTTNQVLAKNSNTDYDTKWVASGAGSVTSVSSSTSDVTVVSISTTPIITAINAATSGNNAILRLTSTGLLPALNASLLMNVLGAATFYNLSSSSSTAISASSLKFSYGFAATGAQSSSTITNLPFTTTSYGVLFLSSDKPSVTSNQYFSIVNSSSCVIACQNTNVNFFWLAIGV